MTASVKDKGRIVEWNRNSDERSVDSRSRLERANEVFEHFQGSAAIPPSLVLTNEGTAVTAATYGTLLGGAAVISSDDILAKSASLNSQGLCWQANRQPEDQPLVFECRVNVGTLSGREFWFGVSDALADTDPIALSTTSTFTKSVPTDCAVIGYSDTPLSGNAFTSGGNQHTSIAIKTNTDTIVATGGGTFVTATNYVYRIEIDSGGNAVYFVDGSFHSWKAAALAANVPLGIVMYAVPRASAGGSEAVFTIDYVYLGGK